MATKFYHSLNLNSRTEAPLWGCLQAVKAGLVNIIENDVLEQLRSFFPADSYSHKRNKKTESSYLLGEPFARTLKSFCALHHKGP